MILTTNQELGLKECVSRYKNHERMMIISGYAGTGKSTLVRFIIDALNLDESRVCYAAYTGKAAQVLRNKGCANAITLHRLLYKSHPNPDGTFSHERVSSINFDVIVVDEISMVPKKMIDQLMEYPIFLIGLGDPFQLPPIKESKDDTHDLLSHPNIFLDEITRQAKENEIIRFTLGLREGAPMERYCGENLIIVPFSEINTGFLTWADQILCATNARRKSINDQMRALAGRGMYPETGDKVICLHNYDDIVDDVGDSLVNGTIGYLKDPKTRYLTFPYWTQLDRMPFLRTGLDTINDSCFAQIELDRTQIMTGEKFLTDPQIEYRLRRSKWGNEHQLPLSFDYAYAITTHKAQGSEWDKVLYIEEGFPFPREEHLRHLYTGATRASKQLIVAMKEKKR